VKGIFIVQLQTHDFSYNGKDLTIWTAVETATAIIAASIPVLRVFFKETISSYSRSHSASTKTGSVPLSRLNRSQHFTTTTTVQALGHDKDFGWVELGEGDGSSQRNVLGDEENVREGIYKTDTVTVTVESDRRSDTKARSFLGIG
jgi:hypothetical protein